MKAKHIVTGIVGVGLVAIVVIGGKFLIDTFMNEDNPTPTTTYTEPGTSGGGTVLDESSSINWDDIITKPTTEENSNTTAPTSDGGGESSTTTDSTTESKADSETSSTVETAPPTTTAEPETTTRKPTDKETTTESTSINWDEIMTKPTTTVKPTTTEAPTTTVKPTEKETTTEIETAPPTTTPEPETTTKKPEKETTTVTETAATSNRVVVSAEVGEIEVYKKSNGLTYGSYYSKKKNGINEIFIPAVKKTDKEIAEYIEWAEDSLVYIEPGERDTATYSTTQGTRTPEEQSEWEEFYSQYSTIIVH